MISLLAGQPEMSAIVGSARSLLAVKKGSSSHNRRGLHVRADMIAGGNKMNKMCKVCLSNCEGSTNCLSCAQECEVAACSWQDLWKFKDNGCRIVV